MRTPTLFVVVALTLCACGGAALQQPQLPSSAPLPRLEVAEASSTTSTENTLAANPSGVPTISPLDAPVANR